MVNRHWLELPLSLLNFHGSKDVRAIEVLLYIRRYISLTVRLFCFLDGHILQAYQLSSEMISSHNNRYFYPCLLVNHIIRIPFHFSVLVKFEQNFN